MYERKVRLTSLPKKQNHTMRNDMRKWDNQFLKAQRFYGGWTWHIMKRAQGNVSKWGASEEPGFQNEYTKWLSLNEKVKKKGNGDQMEKEPPGWSNNILLSTQFFQDLGTVLGTCLGHTRWGGTSESTNQHQCLQGLAVHTGRWNTYDDLTTDIN